MGKLFTTYGIEASILTSGASEAEVYSELADGIDNIAEALNEVVQQFFFLKDKGFATNHVTGMAPAYTFTGRRVMGDTAQDFIFGKKYSLDTDRQSKLKIAYKEGSTEKTITCN